MALPKHTVVTAKLVVTSARSGLAKFVDEASLPDELTRDGMFRSQQFAAFNDGDIVEATFRVSSQSRHLQSVHRAGAAPLPREVEVAAAFKEGEFINGIFFNARAMIAYKAADALAQQRGVANMFVSGPSGYGKTSMAKAFAERTGRSFQRFNCALVSDTEEWFGYREARDGSTIFCPTEFTTMVSEGNCVILLDEFNRIEPWLSNSLMPLLDDARETVVHGERIAVGDNVVFVKTCNIGYQYVGTFEIDKAQKNRNDIYLEVGPLSKAVEVQLLQDRSGIKARDAEQIVSVMEQLRRDAAAEDSDVDVTTRSSLKVAYLMAVGLDARTAFEFAVVAASSNRKGITDIVTARLGTFSERYETPF